MKITSQFFRFALIGIINTGVHYITFIIFLRVFGVWMLLSSSIGYCVGIINSFVMNRKWTFQSTFKNRHIEFGKFVVVNMIALSVNIAVLQIAVQKMALLPEIAQIGAIGISLVVNFVGNKLWTFRK